MGVNLYPLKFAGSCTFYLTLLAFNCLAQKEVPINIVLKNVTVRDFKAPYTTLPVLVEKDESRYPALEINEQTTFKKDRRTSLPLANLKQGMRVVVTIDYLQESNKAIAKEIMLDNGYYTTTTLEGIFEDISGERAYVDGQTVTLVKDKKIKGQEGWKGKEFSKFSDMQLGSSLRLRGKRDLDGVINVESGTVTPVLMADDDRMLRKGMSLVMKVNLDEIKIGNKKSIPIISARSLQAYITTIGDKLIPNYLKKLPLDHPDRVDFRFYIANDELVNAAALPDGVVLINTGLLKAVKNEAQLSAVIGHEVAHVLYKHHTAKMRNSNDWKGVPAAAGIVAGSLAGADAGAAALMLSEAVSKMSMNSFSRKKESQADRIGLYYMVNAGYDPREAAAFWLGRIQEAQEKIDEKQMKNAGQALALSLTGNDSSLEDDEDDKEDEVSAPVSNYDATHPKLKDRFVNLNFLLATTYSSVDYSKLKTGEEDYKAFMDELTGKKKAPAAPGGSTDARKKPKGKTPLKQKSGATKPAATKPGTKK
ncbi:M48 family metalloprotease [Dyadobacter pollutisoli]|uniref:M48 family metalloprotease n=1 Tax=Dyadobacter pollutisoli TaxID=2910158 RepID=A0A9E8NF03_9BACT|nr:M48 family metalloprotease [Dyadobacter pollutisoli]WAC13092.1 M48 family metalloprotease [Dyadobacter pollutisoli]